MLPHSCLKFDREINSYAQFYMQKLHLRIVLNLIKENFWIQKQVLRGSFF